MGRDTIETRHSPEQAISEAKVYFGEGSPGLAVENTRMVEWQRQRIAGLEARNKELEAFAHAVAHDLRAPLTLVLGFAEILREDCDELSCEELAKYLGFITRNGRQMEDTIDDLLSSAETH